MKTVIICQSKYGQTEKISFGNADVLRSGENEVEVLNVARIKSDFSLKPFDTVVFGGPIYVAMLSSKLSRMIKKNLSVLAEK